MPAYKIPRKIARFEIFQPKTTLKSWLSKQNDKPDILFNASLYTSTNKPCGTIWNDGVMVSDQGNGFGFGTTDGKTIEFGSPYSKKWRDYITGYYGLVQNGKAIDPPWKDSYVFDKALNRIAFGQFKSGEFAIFCENGKTIKQYASNAERSGFKFLCNLDGGGSRALYWLGKWIYTSTRTPYNAVAIWLEPEKTIIKPSVSTGKEVSSVQVVCNVQTKVYNSSGKVEIGRYITKGDICELRNKLDLDNLQIEIVYPAGNNMRTAYIKDLGNFTKL